MLDLAVGCPRDRGSAARPDERVRWGLGDVLWVWFVGLVAGAIAGSDRRRRSGAAAAGSIPTASTSRSALFAQNGGDPRRALVSSAGSRASGPCAADFGLVVRGRDWPWLAAGVLLQVVSIGIVQLLDAGRREASTEQQAADTVKHSPRARARPRRARGGAVRAPWSRSCCSGACCCGRCSAGPPPVGAVDDLVGGVRRRPPARPEHRHPDGAASAPRGDLGDSGGSYRGLSQSILLHVGFNLLSAVLLVTT